jgi:DNA repair protein RecO (recombination protein O)
MFEKTKGIVLHQLKYDDKKRIVTIYTEKFGRTTFIISNTKKLSINLFRPFNLLEINLINRNNSKLNRIADASILINYKTIPYNVQKSSVALFISEILYKILNEEAPNEELFNFILNSISLLDNIDENVSMFHIVFLIKLTKYFGFLPYNNYSKINSTFDLIEGVFISQNPTHKNYLTLNQSQILHKILEIDYNKSFNLSRIERTELLGNLILYYKIHHEAIDEIKSLDILKEVFS